MRKRFSKQPHFAAKTAIALVLYQLLQKQRERKISSGNYN